MDSLAFHPVMTQLEPYRRFAAPDEAGAGGQHPVSQEPLVEPKISSITVTVAVLEDWEDNWVEAHGHHCTLELSEFPCDPDDLDPSLVRYGPLPDPGDGWELDEENSEQLIMCCGDERPRRTRGKPEWRLRVDATGTGDEGFVTVHDYVSQVHP